MTGKLRASAMVSILALTCFSLARAGDAPPNNQKQVKAAVAGFYSALNVMLKGDPGPMKKAWSHSADVVYMGPVGGEQIGWSEVQKSWDAQAAMKLGGKVDGADFRYFVDHNVAVVFNHEKGEIKVNGKAEKVSIRATNVFRKESGKWKMIAHHTDLLPNMAK